jgi:hypothetical protein
MRESRTCGSVRGARDETRVPTAPEGLHQGQQSIWAASKGRTHDCKRPLCGTPNYLLPGGGHPHMKRREFIRLLGGAAAAWPLAVEAGPVQRTPRIAVLHNRAADDPEGQLRLTAFVQGLQQLDWALGRNLRIDYRWKRG